MKALKLGLSHSHLPAGICHQARANDSTKVLSLEKAEKPTSVALKLQDGSLTNEECVMW